MFKNFILQSDGLEKLRYAYAEPILDDIVTRRMVEEDIIWPTPQNQKDHDYRPSRNPQGIERSPYPRRPNPPTMPSSQASTSHLQTDLGLEEDDDSD